jgi:hypothetical protein
MLPSHGSILTGTFPPYHGVRGNDFYRLDDDALSLAERLGNVEYTTAAFISAFPRVASFRLVQGFAIYDDRLIDWIVLFYSRLADF